MSDKPHKHEKWEKFKRAMKKAGKWTVKNLLPVAISMAAGGLGLPAALGGLASELFKKLSDANLNVPISEDMFKEKLEDLCKGEGKTIEYLQKKLEQANEQMKPEDIKLVLEHVMTPVVSEMSTMLEIMSEEKTDLRELLAGWLEEQTQLIRDQSQMIQNEFLLSHDQLSVIQNEMLNGFQKMEFQQTQILENINNIQSRMQLELAKFKQELAELIQAQFGQSGQTACDLDTMFNLATVHFNQQNLASRFDQPYDPDLYVRPELFFELANKYLSEFKDPMKKNVPIFLLLAHLGMGKTWNFAYITEYMLIERNIAIPFFINLKDGLQQQLEAIFNTQNMREIVDRCQKIKSETQLPIFLILDGLDELTASDLKDVLLILKQLLLKRTDALCVALSCRIVAWVQDQQILNERNYFEDHVWFNQHSTYWKAQFDIATPISCVLGEFSDNELNIAIERYDLKKQHFSAGLYEISHQPYILRLVSEFVSLHNKYPSPEDPQSMASLFYSDDLDAQKNTILYRMGIHGNILSLFSLIIEEFPSADSELTEKSFQEFANNPYFRPILYSGIIIRVRRQMITLYKINPVYVPLLSLSFPHLLKQEPGKRTTQELREPTNTEIITPTSIDSADFAKKVQYFLSLADKRKDEKNFDAEFEALKEAERVVTQAYDISLTDQVEKRIEEFEKQKRIREETERIVNFKGVKIIKKEMEVLTELEKEVGEIPIISFSNNNESGVTIKGNRVVGLILYSKELTLFSESIIQLTTLEKLAYHNNKLKSIPETIGQLTTLKELDLSCNHLTTLPDAIGQLKSLEKLNLSINNLTTLPDAMGQLTALKELYLYDNQLMTLPETIGQLTALKKLYLSNNQLKSIPETIGQMTALEILFLDFNQLKSIPETIGQLTTLNSLFLARNQLTTIPKSIGQMKSLETLSLHRNQLKSIPETIGQLTSLEILGLYENQLKSLPESIGQMKSLKQIVVRNNQLKSIPESIGLLTELIFIDLSDNQLKSLPESIGKLTALKKICIQQNRLKSLPETLANLVNLEEIDVDDKLVDDYVVNYRINNGFKVNFKD